MVPASGASSSSIYRSGSQNPWLLSRSGHWQVTSTSCDLPRAAFHEGAFWKSVLPYAKLGGDVLVV